MEGFRLSCFGGVRAGEGYDEGCSLRENGHHAGVIALNADHESWRSPRLLQGLRERAPTTSPPGHLL